MTKAQQKKNKEIIFERQTLALQYRLCGLSYRAIGQKLQISHVQAIADVRAAFARYEVQTRESALEMIWLENERLDMALVALAPQIAKGELGAIDRAIRISESRRKLWGLDAPMKIAPTNPEGDKSYEPPSVNERLTTIDERFGRIETLLNKARARRDKAPKSASE